MRFESWTWTIEEMELKWESGGKYDRYDFSMNEYRLVDWEFNETLTEYNMPVPMPVPDRQVFTATLGGNTI